MSGTVPLLYRYRYCTGTARAKPSYRYKTPRPGGSSPGRMRSSLVPAATHPKWSVSQPHARAPRRRPAPLLPSATAEAGAQTLGSSTSEPRSKRQNEASLNEQVPMSVQAPSGASAGMLSLLNAAAAEAAQKKAGSKSRLITPRLLQLARPTPAPSLALQLPRPVEWLTRPAATETTLASSTASIDPVSAAASGMSQHHHRRAPSLQHHRSAPELPRNASQFTAPQAREESRQSRALPERYETALISEKMRAALIHHALRVREELVILVEMRPRPNSAVGSLQHDEGKYQQQLNQLTHAVDGALRSHQYPENCYFTTRVMRLPEDWGDATRSGPAFFDWQQGLAQASHEANLASNLPRAGFGAAASRLGAYEVFVVWKPAGRPGSPSIGQGVREGVQVEVEQLFSKLFSRCWPRVDALLNKLRKRPYFDEEMLLREGRHALRTVNAFADLEGIRDIINEHRLRPDWAKLAQSDEAKIAIEFLAEKVTENEADPALRAALAARSRWTTLRLARQVTKKAKPGILAAGLAFVEQAPAADDPVEEAPAADTPVEEVVINEAEAGRAKVGVSIKAGKFARLLQAKSEAARTASEARAAAEAKAAAEEVFRLASEKVSACTDEDSESEAFLQNLEFVAANHLAAASPVVVAEVMKELQKYSDIALRKLLTMESRGRETYERWKHRMKTCSPEVLDMMQRKLEMVSQHESQLSEAVDSLEATGIVNALQSMEKHWSPVAVAAACEKLQPLLVADAALKAAMATRKKPILEQAAEEHCPNCSPSVAEEVKRARISISDAMLKHVLSTGDKVALEDAANGKEKHLETCSFEVAAEVRRKQEAIVQTEAELARALEARSAAAIVTALRNLDVRFNPIENLEAHKVLGPLLQADTQLLAAVALGDFYSPTTKQLLATCSRDLAQEVRQKGVEWADRSLCTVLAEGDQVAFERVWSICRDECSQAVARTSEEKIDQVMRMKAALLNAIETREASDMYMALAHPEVYMWHPQLASVAQAKLSDTLRADEDLQDTFTRGEHDAVLERTSGANALMCGCSPSLIKEITDRCVALADREIRSILLTGDKQRLEDAAKHRLKLCSANIRNEVKFKLKEVTRLETRLRKALRSGEAMKVKTAIFDCDVEWSPGPMAMAKAELAKIVKADAMIEASRTCSTDLLWVIRKMTEAVEEWGNRASPSVVEKALIDIEAMKMEPSKAVKIALKIGSKIGSTVVQLLRYGRGSRDGPPRGKTKTDDE